MKRLAEFKDKLYVRVSFKAATPEGFTQRTGTIGEFYELPFKALKYLLDEGIDARTVAMTDNRIMPGGERKILVQMLNEVDPKTNYAKSLGGRRRLGVKHAKSANEVDFAVNNVCI